jgi:soluble lytic murein transglycosylase-like protein
MDRLYFGMRARRRARFKRMAFWASLVSTAAMLAGIPGTGGALEFVDRFGVEAMGRTESAIQTTETMSSMRRFQNRMFDTRPTPSPGGPASEGSIVEIIEAAAARHGVDGAYLVSVAECESGLDPQAYNSAGYHGLFQFDESTWSSYGDGSIWDPAAQADAAAELFADGQSSRWPVCA